MRLHGDWHNRAARALVSSRSHLDGRHDRLSDGTEHHRFRRSTPGSSRPSRSRSERSEHRMFRARQPCVPAPSPASRDQRRMQKPSVCNPGGLPVAQISRGWGLIHGHQWGPPTFSWPRTQTEPASREQPRVAFRCYLVGSCHRESGRQRQVGPCSGAGAGALAPARTARAGDGARPERRAGKSPRPETEAPIHSRTQLGRSKWSRPATSGRWP